MVTTRSEDQGGMTGHGTGTVIVAPLRAELAGVLARTQARRALRLPAVSEAGAGAARRRRRAWTATLGRLMGEEVALLATGDGPEAAAAGLAALLTAVRPRRVLAL